MVPQLYKLFSVLYHCNFRSLHHVLAVPQPADRRRSVSGVNLRRFQDGHHHGRIPGIDFHGNFRHWGFHPGGRDNIQHHRCRLHHFNRC